MSEYLTAALRGSEPKAWKAMRFFSQAIAFGIVEVLAARELDGWLSFALWCIAAYNALLVVVAVMGLSMIAARVQREAS